MTAEFRSETAVYTAIEQLGKGGMGVTHLVRREDDGAELVLKELRIEMLEDWKALELFEREIATLETLDHPGIPRYVDKIVDRETGMAALVQTRVAGRTLAELMEAGQSVAAERFVELLRQCLEILAYLHERVPPIVHRDVNPRNLMIDDARAYLIDFGAVKLPWSRSTTFTSVGTFGYMPPEQVLGAAEPASDLFALAMTFIALATGREPADLPKERRTGQVAPASVLDVLEPIRGVLLEMVRPGLGERLGNAREALARLSEPPSRRRWARVRRRVLAASLTLPALVLGVGWGLSQIPAEHEVMTLGGWFTGHGDFPSSVEATLLRGVPLANATRVSALAFRPDGLGLISSARDGALAWNLENGSVTAEHEPERFTYDGYSVVQFTDDGSTVVAATFDGDVSLLDADTLRLVGTRGAERPGRLLDIRARAAEDIRLAVFARSMSERGGLTASVVVSEITTSRAVFEDDVEWLDLDDGDLSGNGRYLAIVGRDKRGPKWVFPAIVWDLEEGRRIATVEQSDRDFLQVLLSQDGSRMATLDYDGIALWDTTTGERKRELGVRSTEYDAQMVANADLSTIVVTTRTGAQIFDGRTGLLRQTVDGHSLRVSSVALSPDAGMITTGSQDQTIKLWAL